MINLHAIVENRHTDAGTSVSFTPRFIYIQRYTCYAAAYLREKRFAMAVTKNKTYHIPLLIVQWIVECHRSPRA